MFKSSSLMVIQMTVPKVKLNLGFIGFVGLDDLSFWWPRLQIFKTKFDEKNILFPVEQSEQIRL